MAEFTAEQQEAINLEVARITADRNYQANVELARREHESNMETSRLENTLTLELRRAKLESVRLAKETLLENSKSKAVDERDVDANSIVSFAATLVNYVNS